MEGALWRVRAVEEVASWFGEGEVDEPVGGTEGVGAPGFEGVGVGMLGTCWAGVIDSPRDRFPLELS